MKNATDFGKTIRELMARNNLRQKQLAKVFGVSPGSISNYIIGKNVPEMDFLAKCANFFNLEGRELKTFFTNAFLSTCQNNQKIIIDTHYFREESLKPLIHVIVTLLLYQGKESLPAPLSYHPKLTKLIENIKICFNDIDTDEFVELLHHSKTE